MKKILILFFIIIQFLLFSNKITFWDNSFIFTKQLRYENGILTTDNGEFDISNVSYIIFETEKKEREITRELSNISSSELIERANYLEKKYPDSPVLILYDDGIQQLNKDGSRYSRYRYSIKILNEKELSRSILTFYHEPGKHEVNIIMARSISKDGKISYLDKNKIEYTKPKQELSFFATKDDAFYVKGVIPDVMVGSIIDYEVEIFEPSPVDKNQFYTNWFFADEYPVYESTVRFIVPEDKEFYWVIKNFSPYNDKPEINIKDGYKIYFFKRGEAAPFILEPYSPHIRELLPFVIGSTFKDQEYLSKWISRFLLERLDKNAEMEKEVYSILEKNNAKSEEEVVAAIYRYIQENIHYRSIKSSFSSGYAGHPATETFKNKYGDCIDKSILFTSMLRIAGIDAYPIILMTNDQARVYYNEIGLISGNHAITEIHLKEKGIIFLDPTSKTFRYPYFREDDQCVFAWNPILNKVRFINPIPAELNRLKYIKKINLSFNGDAVIISNSIYSGELEAGIREYLQSLTEKEIQSFFSSIIVRDYPGSLLLRYAYSDLKNYSKPFSLELEYIAKNIAKKAGRFLILTLPFTYNFNIVSLSKRKYPLALFTTEARTHIFEIEIPEGYEIKGGRDIYIENKYFTYKASYKIERNKVIFNDDFVRNGTWIENEDYIYFREDMLKLEHFVKTPLIFEKKKNSK